MTSSMDRSLRFDTYVVGASNRLAVSAARAVADAPGQAYNPLFIYGGSGLGKTHLVAAIAHRVREVQPALRVRCSSGEEVAELLHRAVASGQPQLLLEPFAQTDLLILDDVQFLTGQQETQSELRRLLNVLLGGGQQLVLTSDRQPSEIPDVDQRLLSRLSGGLVVDVGAPDFEMRLAILRNVVADRSLSFADGVLDEVARLPFGNVRELKGALNKLTAYQQLDGRPVASDEVRAVLGVHAAPTAPSTPERIRAIIPSGADYEGFLADVLMEVETRVEPWRVRIGEAIGTYRADGWNVGVLERALQAPQPIDAEGLLRAYAAAVDHLRGLEVQAVAIAPGLRGHGAFRNVEAIPAAEQLLQHTIAAALPLPPPSPGFTRAAIQVGAENQLAVRAIDAVIDAPGAGYNPLFLHGPAGSGKTHCAHAIGNAVKARWPGKQVACLPARQFVEEYIAAMQEGGVERWRVRYRHADVLILDDVQELEGKERTQDELFHLFNLLVGRGGQVVLTSSRPPKEMLGLADRLRSRFEGGLVVLLAARERLRLDQLAGLEPGERDRFFEDGEKTMWRWPELGGRLIEEYR
ncbi:MAG: DnaA ATPase domain-containing protein [Gemmatimonas sp.]|uniref:DnaA/Hda family protein n=2 Tax=Gemmatimonas sp. TaxID=1962908 RepID=UPI0022C9C8D0|nr:DnaA/Hda family protein [Gemmatimonas sp.]MCA2983793.1 ATP-binding protein [Gemmatimonas sp.]MCA2986324.1 ATP-binding protein [Gemmatimonas sp.]MCA2996006.1 ATP-binding protein [Gemmatimonas sp.]MCE2953612.1 ATP-binding protein [Gemmatimonas sp.]MCZ8267073.1 DnaA/Hda family protein [Gemmatimonas sp.]